MKIEVDGVPADARKDFRDMLKQWTGGKARVFFREEKATVNAPEPYAITESAIREKSETIRRVRDMIKFFRLYQFYRG